MNDIPFYLQLILNIVYQIDERLSRVEDSIQRNNDLVAALLKSSGIQITLRQGGVDIGGNSTVKADRDIVGGNESKEGDLTNSGIIVP